MFFDDRRFLCRGMALTLLVGIALRVVIGITLEYNNDVTAWTNTLANIESGNGLYNVAGYYYPPVWGYILASFSEVIGFLGIDQWSEIFTEILFVQDYNSEDAMVSTPVFNLALTVMYMFADLLGALAVYWLINHFTEDTVKAKIGFAVYFIGLNIIFVGALGGMFDSFSALMTLLCIILLIKRNDFLSGIMFSMAVLLKLFPVFIFFIVVAYLLKKEGRFINRRLALWAAGAGLALLVLYLPQILEGNLMDSLSFITARAGNAEGTGNILLKYSSMLIYPVIAILEVFAAYRFLKKDTYDIDRTFVWFVLISLAVVFIYPSTPQYILLMMPFLIVAAFVHESRLTKPLLLLIIGGAIFQTSSLPFDLLSITMFWDAMSLDAWNSLYDLFYSPLLGGFNLMNIWSVVGAIPQYLSVLMTLWIILEHGGIDLRGKIRKAVGRETAATE
jgi:hypothetical protein